MLILLNPELLEGVNPGPLPEWLKPLLNGAQTRRPLHEAIQDIVASFGFTSFVYGLTTSGHLSHEEQFFIWTTAPSAWVVEYDQNSYIEIDPRVHHGWNEVTPYIWDCNVGCGDPKIEHFLERAASFGIASGVNMFLRDSRRARIMVGLNSPDREMTKERVVQISERLGDFMLLGTIFHAFFIRPFIEKGLAPPQRGYGLSRREIQCLELAARGQTSGDIAFKLGIAERTANYHFGNILRKLGAMNRSEAIAKAMSHGLLRDF